MGARDPAARSAATRLAFAGLVAAAVAAIAAAPGCRTAPASSGPLRGEEGAVELLRSVGVVRAVDLEERFVIVDFGVNRVPAPGTEMRVRRGNGIVGTVRVAEPSAAPLAAADVLSGAPAAGDLVE